MTNRYDPSSSSKLDDVLLEAQELEQLLDAPAHCALEDDLLSSELLLWSSQQPAPSFAANVIAQAQQESQLRKKRGIVIPLLLAAVLLPAAAWAAWHSASSAVVLHQDEEPARPTQPSPQTVRAHAPSLALPSPEPEPAASPAPATSAGQHTPRSAPRVRQSEAPAQQEPPPVVHQPRCHCGLAAMVCSCIDE